MDIHSEPVDGGIGKFSTLRTGFRQAVGLPVGSRPDLSTCSKPCSKDRNCRNHCPFWPTRFSGVKEAIERRDKERAEEEKAQASQR